MKRLTIAVVLVVLCAMSGLPQSRNKRRPPTPREPPIIDIHQIDFKNQTFSLNGKSYKLIDGFYAENIAPNTQWGLEMVDGPDYGYLTGDKKEEVAFVLRYGPIASPDTAEVRVYTLQNGQPALLATFVVANSVSCQLDHYIEIKDGMISVERIYGNGPRCDYNEVIQYRWNGNSFLPVGTAKRMPCRCM